MIFPALRDSLSLTSVTSIIELAPARAFQAFEFRTATWVSSGRFLTRMSHRKCHINVTFFRNMTSKSFLKTREMSHFCHIFVT